MVKGFLPACFISASPWSNSIVLGDNSKTYGDNSKGYGFNSASLGDRNHTFKKA